MKLTRLKNVSFDEFFENDNKNSPLTEYGELALFAMKELLSQHVFLNSDGELFSNLGEVCQKFNQQTCQWEVYGGAIAFMNDTKTIEWIPQSVYVDQLLH